MSSPEERLKAFQAENHITTKGPLSLVVQFTRMVRDKAFPLNSDDFQTSSKGQVAGLGGANLKKILKEHGITQQLLHSRRLLGRAGARIFQKSAVYLDRRYFQNNRRKSG